MGDERGRDGGSDPAREARWAAAAEDLSGDYNLRGCPTARFAGAERPSLGRNVLLARLGSGGMGVVYHAVNPRLGSEVAVKVLPPALLELQGVLADRLQREAQLAAQVDSPHLVRVLDVDHDEGSGCHFIVMEFVDGPTAASWADAKAPPERDVLRLGLAAAKGLAAAHREGIVHRDVKPGNLLLPPGEDGRPDPDRVKVADLGLARMVSAGADITRTAAAMGTPGFMAPEQIRDSRGAGKAADVFGLGATLYALLTGSPPFDGETPADALVRTAHGAYAALETVRSDVGPATRVLVHKCLEQRPAERFPDGAALARALELALEALGANAGTVDAARSSISSLTGAPEEGLPVLAVPTPEPADTRGVAIERPVPTGRPFGAVALAGLVLIVAATLLAPGFGVGPKVVFAAAIVLFGIVVLAVAAVARRGARGDGRSASSVPAPVPADSGGVGPARTPAITLVLRVALISAVAAALVFAGTLMKVGRGPGPVTTAPTLLVTSAPPGAVVTVDGSRRGITPVQVAGLSPGTHEIVLTKDYYKTIRENAHVATNGRSTHVAALAPAETWFFISGGGGPGSVRLTRKVPPSHQVGFGLEADGSFDEVEVECGEYEWAWIPEAGPAKRGTITLRAEAAAVLDLGGKAGTGLISISTEPPGAEVLLDDVVIGRTPLTGYRADAGFHVMTLRLRHHDDHRFKMTLDQDEHERLESATLTPWGVLTLGSISDDVVAFHGGRRLGETTPLPPKSQTVVLKRSGYADQEVTVMVPLAATRPLEPRPWVEYQARLDLSAVPRDVDVHLDGAALRGVHTSVAAIKGALTFSRAGIPTAGIPVDVQLGSTWTAEPVQWQSLLGRLVFSDLGPRVRFSLEGEDRTGEVFVDPGEHSVTALLDRALPVVLTVDAKSGETTFVRTPGWHPAEDALPLHVVSSDGLLSLGKEEIRPTKTVPLFLRPGDDLTVAKTMEIVAFGTGLTVARGLLVKGRTDRVELAPRGRLTAAGPLRTDRSVRLLGEAVEVILPSGWSGEVEFGGEERLASLKPQTGGAHIEFHDKLAAFCELPAGVDVVVTRPGRDARLIHSRNAESEDLTWLVHAAGRDCVLTIPGGAMAELERLPEGVKVSCPDRSRTAIVIEKESDAGKITKIPLEPGAHTTLE